ncbi:MAG TPA: hypothetical protein GX719_02385 [Gammaproteobacteria bacterium]|nr:hypothetical protein [Gammaproteobacteria bacterium]
MAALAAAPARYLLIIGMLCQSAVRCWRFRLFQKHPYVVLGDLAAMLQALQVVNECFEVGVVSEPRMASAGVEPRMGSSTD